MYSSPQDVVQMEKKNGCWPVVVSEGVGKTLGAGVPFYTNCLPDPIAVQSDAKTGKASTRTPTLWGGAECAS